MELSTEVQFDPFSVVFMAAGFPARFRPIVPLTGSVNAGLLRSSATVRVYLVFKETLSGQTVDIF